MSKSWVLAVPFPCCAALPLLAQSAAATVALPSAPVPDLNLSLQAAAPQTGSGSAAQRQRLTRAEAEQLAIHNNPRITVDSESLIEFGILLLIATPICRVIFGVIGFSMERERFCGGEHNRFGHSIGKSL